MSDSYNPSMLKGGVFNVKGVSVSCRTFNIKAPQSFNVEGDNKTQDANMSDRYNPSVLKGVVFNVKGFQSAEWRSI